MAESSTKRTGSCMCGQVQFEITAEPMIAVVCHCLACQKLSGAGHAFHMVVPESAFSSRGATKGYDWVADSGNRITTSFCPECGSPLFARNSGFPGAVGFRAASLDQPLATRPMLSTYSKRLQPWDHLELSIPAFEAMPPPSAIPVG